MEFLHNEFTRIISHTLGFKSSFEHNSSTRRASAVSIKHQETPGVRTCHRQFHKFLFTIFRRGSGSDVAENAPTPFEEDSISQNWTAEIKIGIEDSTLLLALALIAELGLKLKVLAGSHLHSFLAVLRHLSTQSRVRHEFTTGKKFKLLDAYHAFPGKPGQRFTCASACETYSNRKSLRQEDAGKAPQISRQTDNDWWFFRKLWSWWRVLHLYTCT